MNNEFIGKELRVTPKHMSNVHYYSGKQVILKITRNYHSSNQSDPNPHSVFLDLCLSEKPVGKPGHSCPVPVMLARSWWKAIWQRLSNLTHISLKFLFWEIIQGLQMMFVQVIHYNVLLQMVEDWEQTKSIIGGWSGHHLVTQTDSLSSTERVTLRSTMIFIVNKAHCIQCVLH